MIQRITITGADGSIDPNHLLRLSKQYPFVEWGILFSKGRKGLPRYPSEHWLRTLKSVYHKNPDQMHLSAHLCGSMVHEILMGYAEPLTYINEFWEVFSRIQLNVQQQVLEYQHRFLIQARKTMLTKDIILQIDSRGSGLFNQLKRELPQLQLLHDQSGGRGIQAECWPEPVAHHLNGYAGGLNPENLAIQLELLEELTGSNPYWVDLESGVRTTSHDQFNLLRVENCLRLVENHRAGQTLEYHDN